MTVTARSLNTIRRTVCSRNSSSTSASATATANNTNDERDRETETELRLAFLGCEVLPPYGPYDHTAELFADLIATAWSAALVPSNHQQTCTLVLEVYGVVSGNQEDDDDDDDDQPSLSLLPSERDLQAFDGVVLPGSFSSACDTDTLWILALRDWIQTTLVAKEVPTLGVCFGHQLYAHSFEGGSNGKRGHRCGGGTAVRCPAGPQAGRKTTEPTPSGRAFLAIARNEMAHRDDNHQRASQLNSDGKSKANDNHNHTIAGSSGLDLFYTHGDMVESLPSKGVSLGGNDKVPIQAALYFSAPVSTANAELILRDIVRNHLDHDRKETFGPSGPRVIAVTFQAHPEFACWGGQTKGDETLRKTMELMRDHGDLSEEDYRAALSDADASSMDVRDQSLEAMVSAGRLLGWFG